MLLKQVPMTLTLSVSLPGLTGQSSTHGRCLLDRLIEPSDDNVVCVNLNEKRRNAENPQDLGQQ